MDKNQEIRGTSDRKIFMKEKLSLRSPNIFLHHINP